MNWIHKIFRGCKKFCVNRHFAGNCNFQKWNKNDYKIISLYSPGMTVSEIQQHLTEMYGTEVSGTLISAVTDAVIDEVKQWQSRPVDSVYPIVYLDCIHVKIRDSGAVRVKAAYLDIGINMNGEKEVLGLWIAQTEGAKFWLSVVTELKTEVYKISLLPALTVKPATVLPSLISTSMR